MKKIRIGVSEACFAGALLSTVIVFFSFFMKFVTGYFMSAAKSYKTGLDFLSDGSAYQKGLILASLIISTLIIAAFVLYFLLKQIRKNWFRYVAATLIFALSIISILLFGDFLRTIDYLSKYSLDMTEKSAGAGLWLNLIFSIISVGFIMAEFNSTVLKKIIYK